MSHRSKSFSSFALAVGASALFAGDAMAQGQRIVVNDAAGYTLTDATVSYRLASQPQAKAQSLGDGSSLIADYQGKATIIVEHSAYGRHEFEFGDGTVSSSVLVINLGTKQVTPKFLSTATVSDLSAQTPGQALSPGNTAGCQLPDQMGHGGTGALFATSDRNSLYGHRVADDFQPTQDGQISGVTFWGTYYDYATQLSGTPALDSFTVTYLNDDGTGFGPGGIIAGPFSITPVTVPTGNQILVDGNLIREFQYEAAHPPVDVLSGQSYWISIQNSTTATSAWTWSTASLADGHASQDAGTGFAPVPFDLGFCLDVTLDPTGNGTYGGGSNDDCANAGNIAGTGTFAFDNTFATSDGLDNAACFDFGTAAFDNDVWFAWTADADDMFTIQTCLLTAVDTRIAVYNGTSCPGTDANLLDCNDDTCALQSSVSFNGTNGSTYLVRIGTFPGALGGSGQFSITGANIGGGGNGGSDDCASADPISGTGTFLFDNSSATTDGLDNALCFDFGTAAIDNDVWFAWTAEATETVTVQTCGLTSVDTRLAVYDGTTCPGSDAALLDCNDDTCALQSLVSFSATNGQTYLLRIGVFPGALGGTGGFDIMGAGGGGNNDDCSGAISVGVPSTTAGNTFTATTDTGPDCGAGSGITSPGVWYEVTGTGNTMTASLCTGTAYDSKLSVFCGGCDNLTCVAGIDDFCGLQSQVSWCSQPGASYLILVHGFGGATGAFSLSVSDNGVACAGAVNCAPTGACCTVSGCVVASSADCASMGGAYQGDGTDCGDFTYSAAACNAPFVNIAGTAGAVQLFLGDDDQSTVTMGFPFLFFGNAYTDVTIGSNGYCTFGTSGSDFSNDPIPSTLEPNLLVAPLWDDFNPAAGGSVWYKEFGPLGARAFVVEWNSVPQFAGVDSNTFQVIFWSANERMSFRYGNITPEAFAGDYTVGIENADGTIGVSVNAAGLGAGSCWDITPNISGNPCSSSVAADVTPGMCPNLFVDNVHGLLNVTLLGSTSFDVSNVDQDTLVLSNVGGGPAVYLLQDPYGPGTVISDVTGPDAADCSVYEQDGLLDLTATFSTDLVCQALGMEQLAFGEETAVALSGRTLDGTWFTSSDNVILSAAASGTRLSVTSNLNNAFIRVSKMDLNQTASGFANFNRTYAGGIQLAVTADTSSMAPTFLGWLVNGQFAGTNPVQPISLHTDVNARAVYDVPYTAYGARSLSTSVSLP